MKLNSERSIEYARISTAQRDITRQLLAFKRIKSDEPGAARRIEALKWEIALANSL